MRMIRYLVLGLLAVLLLVVASANRAPVLVRLLPEEVDRFLGLGRQIELPLFLVMFAGILVGLAIGFVWEWIREAALRAEAGEQKRKVAVLEREVSRLKTAEAKPADEILAMIEAKR
jgi:uncharacterized integral membrane protein